MKKSSYLLLFVWLPALWLSGSLVLQPLDYTENPVDIPNPDRGAYRGRWQNISPDSVNETNSPFGITPEVDHRVPVDANSVLYHGRQVPPVEGDDIEETQFYNGVNQNANPYVGGTGVPALPSISFMCFDLCNFSSNAFLSAKDAFGYKMINVCRPVRSHKNRKNSTLNIICA
jgi:hypothetical protein